MAFASSSLSATNFTRIIQNPHHHHPSLPTKTYPNSWNYFLKSQLLEMFSNALYCFWWWVGVVFCVNWDNCSIVDGFVFDENLLFLLEYLSGFINLAFITTETNRKKLLTLLTAKFSDSLSFHLVLEWNWFYSILHRPHSS